MYIGIVNKSARNTSLDNYVLQPLTYQLNSDTVKIIFNTSNTGYMEEYKYQLNKLYKTYNHTHNDGRRTKRT